MKPLTIVLVLALVAGAAAGFVLWRRATEPKRAWAELLELEGVDLRRLEGARRERAHALFYRFLPMAARDPSPPWMLLNLSAPADPPRLLMLTIERQADVDGKSRHALSLWLEGRYLGDEEWWGDAEVDGASAAYDAQLGAWCVTLRMSKGNERRTQVRALTGVDELLADPEEFLLIREEADGRAVLPDWSGLPLKQANGEFLAAKDWPALLREPASPRLLSRLLRLACREKTEDVLGVAGAREALEALRGSPHPWVREAAELALRP